MRKIARYINIAGAIHHGCIDRAIRPQPPRPHADPVGIAEGGINAERIGRPGIRHHHGQPVLIPHFKPRREFPAGRIQNLQSAVGQLASGTIQHQFHTRPHPGAPRTTQGHLHPQIAAPAWGLGNNKVLTQTIHAHGILLREARSHKARHRSIPTDHAHPGQFPDRASLTTHSSGQHPAAARRKGCRAGNRGTKPQTLRSGHPVKLLEAAAQVHHAIFTANHSKPVTRILRGGLGPQFCPGDGGVG